MARLTHLPYHRNAHRDESVLRPARIERAGSSAPMKRPRTEAVWMMTTVCRARMIGSATVTHCAAAARIAVFDHQPRVFRGQLVPMAVVDVIPALVRRMSRRPISSLRTPGDAAHRIGFGQVAGCTWAVPPSPRIFTATSSSGPGRRPVSTRTAPSRAMPMPPPRRCRCRRRSPKHLALKSRHRTLPIPMARTLSPRRASDERFLPVRTRLRRRSARRNDSFDCHCERSDAIS